MVGCRVPAARGGAGRGVHAQPTQRKYVKAEQHREPWAPAFKLLMIGMLVFGSLLSLKLHHDFQARAPTPSVAVTAKPVFPLISPGPRHDTWARAFVRRT